MWRVMGVVRAPLQAERRIDFAVRGPEPAHGDRRQGIDGADELHLLHLRGEHPEHHEEVRVLRARGDVEMSAQWTGDLRRLGQRFAQEGDALREPEIAGGGRLGRWLEGQRRAPGVEEQLGPACARQRPFRFMALHESVAGMAHLQAHAGALERSRVAFQEPVEEGALQAETIVRVEMCPVLEPVHLQVLLFRRGAKEGLGIAPEMEAVTGPVARREERHDHLRPVGAALPMPFVIQRMGLLVLEEVVAVLRQLLLGERLRTGHQLPRDPAAVSSQADAMLDRPDLAVDEQAPEGREDPAVPRQIPVHVGGSLEGEHGGQVRRLLGGHEPLIDCVVGDAEQAHLAGAPRLASRPFDALVMVANLARA